MKTVGFIISTKKNEKRRALIPNDILKVKNKKYLFFEKGYGDVLGYSDSDYIKAGSNIGSRQEVLLKDVICEPKIGDATYLDEILDSKTIFGWVHAVQNKEVTKQIIKKKFSTLAWEAMNKNGRNLFWKNSELAGKAAILHAFPIYGRLPNECKVALIGRGNVSCGAYNILSALGADITVFKRKNQKYLKNDLHQFDVIVNGILWDPFREDHLIYKNDLKLMKKNSLIIDVSCDEKGAIETSRPTEITNPVYFVDGVMHYVVDHTPSLFPLAASKSISNVLKRYIDDIVEDKIKENSVLKNALIIDRGIVKDKDITNYQKTKE